MTDLDDPSAALDSVRRTQSALADRVSRGGWLYDLAYSALLAGAVFAMAFPQPYNWLAFATCVGLLLVLARVWANHVGVWISGYTPARARWVAYGLALCLVPLLLLNLFIKEQDWPAWVAAATSGAAFLLALAASRLWRAVYRRENGLDS